MPNSLDALTLITTSLASASPPPLVPVENPFGPYTHPHPICPPARPINQIPIGGCDGRYHKEITEILTAIRSSDHIFQRYFDFTLTYLERFSVLVANKAELLRHKRSPERYAAYYDSITHTIIINSDKISTKSRMNEALRHEMRHAYWHAMQIYTAGKGTYEQTVSSQQLKKIVRKWLDTSVKATNDLKV